MSLSRGIELALSVCPYIHLSVCCNVNYSLSFKAILVNICTERFNSATLYITNIETIGEDNILQGCKCRKSSYFFFFFENH